MSFKETTFGAADPGGAAANDYDRTTGTSAGPVDRPRAYGDELGVPPTGQVVPDANASLDPLARDKLVGRLRMIEGQVRGIRQMVETRRPCIETLQQVSAVRAALGRVSFLMTQHHIQTCVPRGFAESPERQQGQLNELVDIVDRFLR